MSIISQSLKMLRNYILYITIRECSGEYLIPAHLLYAVWNELDYMAGYQQQDAHEFLIAFLDGLDKHLKLNHPANPPSALSITIPNSISGLGMDSSPVAQRKSPRSESKHRAFSHGSSTPALLRRSFSENEPSSNGSVTFVPRVAEVLDVRHDASIFCAYLLHSLFLIDRVVCIGVPRGISISFDLPRVWP